MSYRPHGLRRRLHPDTSAIIQDVIPSRVPEAGKLTVRQFRTYTLSNLVEILTPRNYRNCPEDDNFSAQIHKLLYISDMEAIEITT